LRSTKEKEIKADRTERNSKGERKKSSSYLFRPHKFVNQLAFILRKR